MLIFQSSYQSVSAHVHNKISPALQQRELHVDVSGTGKNHSRSQQNKGYRRLFVETALLSILEPETSGKKVVRCC